MGSRRSRNRKPAGAVRPPARARASESSPPEPGIPLAVRLLAYAAIAAAALLVHLPTIRHEFLLSWDDPDYVVNNPWIRSWSTENLIHVFTRPYFNNFLPLHLVSYMADYSLWGLKPLGYHLQSVLLDALNAALAFVVVRRLLGSFPVALLAGLLFAVHPSHVEAVAWISSRKEVLSTSFLLLSLYFYLRAGGARSLRWGPYAASVVCFTLGLLSKVSVVVLPPFLLLVDLLVVKTPRRGRDLWGGILGSKVPYALIGLWLVSVNSMAQVKAKAEYAQEPLSYLMVKGHAVWNYLALLTGVPQGNPVYDTPQFGPGPGPIALNLLGLLILPALFWVAYRRGNRPLALGTGWVFLLLLPAILFPLVTYMAERYLYAPTLGFCWALGAGIWGLAGRFPGPRLRVAVAAALASIPIAGFAYRTLEYNAVWRNSETLWTYAIARSRDYRVYNGLGQVRINQKRWAEAERLLKSGSEYENVTSFRNLAVLYYDTQRYPEAHQANDRAMEILARKGNDPLERAELEHIRGAIYWVQSRREEAIRAWEAALRMNPRHEQAREWLRIARPEPTPG